MRASAALAGFALPLPFLPASAAAASQSCSSGVYSPSGGRVRFVNSIRHEYYNMARQLRMTGMDLPSLADEVLTGLEVVACKVEPGCALDGKRLMDTSLRKKYGVTVVGIRHAGQIIPSPGGDAFLHGDDTVFLFASPASLTTVMPFFRTDPEPERAEDL